MIRFPKMHIAESVTNRILNAFDDMREGGMIDVPGAAAGMPEVPSDTQMKGAVIDQAIATPPPELAAPPGEVGAALPGAVARGEDLLAGA